MRFDTRMIKRIGEMIPPPPPSSSPTAVPLAVLHMQDARSQKKKAGL